MTQIRIRQLAIIALFAAAIGIDRAASAQQTQPPIVAVPMPGQAQELILRDGTRAIGRIEKIEDGRVTFRTDVGAVLTVDIAQIVSAKIAVGQIVDGDFWPDDTNATRLFFAPTGRNLKRGESYFGIYEISIPFVQFGITDRLSIGGGTPLIFAEDVSHPFWFTPKLLIISRPTTQVSIGVMHFLNVDRETVGVAYGAITRDSTKSALTVGVGWAYDHSAFDSSDTAVFMIGGDRRLSRRLKLVTENYMVNGDSLISGGVRFMGERFSADFGLIVPVSADSLVIAPMVNLVWKMGK